MKPITIFALTWVLWVVAKGEASKYWGFATVRSGATNATPNAGGASASNAPPATTQTPSTNTMGGGSPASNTVTLAQNITNLLSLTG